MKKVSTILLFFFCFFATAFAQNLQEFSVVNFEEKPLDLSARNERYEIIDGNGDLFAIIKLVSATPDPGRISWKWLNSIFLHAISKASFLLGASALSYARADIISDS